MYKLQLKVYKESMKIQIVEKLNKFLSERQNITEEYEVVYLMVELRKLLDREKDQNKSNSESLVRFHADWALHTSKDHITVPMRAIMQKIDDSIDTYPKNGDISFLLLPDFRTELLQLLEEYSLPTEFCKSDTNWLTFMVALTQVLADQPIVNPTDNMAEFRYVDIKRGGIMANIDFRGTKAGSSITLGFGL